MSARRFVVTGATGFLGGALATHLAAAGHEVLGLGRNVCAGERLRRHGVRFAAVDLAARDALPPDLLGDGADAVIHCAGLSAPWGPGAAFAAANVLGTKRVLDVALQSGAGHFVLISSSSVYFRFQDQRDVREDAILPRPVNAYAASKVEAERIVQGERRIATTVVRPRGLYGKGDGALLPRLLAACDRGPLPLLRGGKAVIDLTHVDDAVGAVVALLGAGPVLPAKLFNVSGGEAIPVRRIVEEAASRTGRRPEWREIPWSVFRAAVQTMEGVHRLVGSRAGPLVTTYSAGLFAFSQTLDIGAIAAATGWRPGVTFEAGLDRTFA